MKFERRELIKLIKVSARFCNAIKMLLRLERDSAKERQSC